MQSQVVLYLIIYELVVVAWMLRQLKQAIIQGLHFLILISESPITVFKAVDRGITTWGRWDILVILYPQACYWWLINQVRWEIRSLFQLPIAFLFINIIILDLFILFLITILLIFLLINLWRSTLDSDYLVFIELLPHFSYFLLVFRFLNTIFTRWQFHTDEIWVTRFLLCGSKVLKNFIVLLV